MNKQEAASYLNVSKRAIERYTKAGKLSVFYMKGKNGNEARYKQEELDAIKEQTQLELHRGMVVDSDEGSEGVGSAIEVVGSPGNLDIARWLMELVNHLVAERSPSPLAAYDELEKAAAQEWILPTSTIKNLIGVTPSGEEFERGSFRFLKAGKVGRECGWLIEKYAICAERRSLPLQKSVTVTDFVERGPSTENSG